MSKDWPTKEKDMTIAQTIMEEYAYKQQSGALGLFELVLDVNEKKMNFRLSNWVVAIAEQFNSLYGPSQGEFITRQVIGNCITHGQTIH